MRRLLFLLVFAPTLASAQPIQEDVLADDASQVFTVPRLNGPIVLDGRVDEAAWDAVAPLPLVTHWPAFGNAPSEPTEIRVAYDDDYLYASCRCYAPPEVVFAASFKRDLYTRSTDSFALLLDTYSDHENGVQFLVTPTGSRTDVAISKDAGLISTSWNTFWDAQTTIGEDGWFAEIRIPFSSLRFRTEDGRVEMGLSVGRLLGRKNEMDIYPAIPTDWGFWSFAKPSQFQRATFKGIRSRRPIYVTPYALGGLGQSFDLNDAEAAYVRTDDSVNEIGADVKMGLSDDLTLDLTLNTDFAQVEADDPQVNLTRFSLFFPEKRQFFLERASLFDVRLGGSNRLFYSRRIGLNEGQSVRLLGGGRLVGRVGPWDLGVISLQTARLRAGLDEALPSENFSVVRLRRPIFNSTSTAGGMITSRLGEDGTHNVAVGLDSDVRLFGKTFLALNVVETFDEAAEDATLFKTTRLRATFERRSYVGTSYGVTTLYSGRDYRPDLGFELRSDYTAFSSYLRQGWSPSSASPLSRHRIGLAADAYVRNGDGTTESGEATVSWNGAFKSGASVTTGVTTSYEDLREGFALTDEVDVVPGSYTFTSSYVDYETAPGSIGGDASVSAGTFYDGWRLTAGVWPRWLVSKHLELSGGYEINRIVFSGRDQAFTAHVGQVRVRAALNTKLSASAFLQVNSTAGAGLTNVRLRYNPREGSDFYLVWNEGFNTNRLRESPARPFTSGRALLAKYTYTFSL